VITGDITQIDLPNTRRSGLLEAAEVLKSVEGVSFNYFTEEDVVRHHLVQRIVRAYEDKTQSQQMSLALPKEIDQQEPQEPPLQQ
jgi:phosphate starvation-inducible PhoH-like protein